MNENLNRFLNQLTRRIAPHAGVRNLVVPEMRSPEVFDSFEPEFRSDLNAWFDFRAIDMIDYLAVNEYWFIMMAAAALVRAETVPVGKQNVQDGVFVLRRRFWRELQSNIVYEKLLKGLADRMSGSETDFAKGEGLLVWDPSTPRGVVMRVNPVFFANTGNL